VYAVDGSGLFAPAQFLAQHIKIVMARRVNETQGMIMFAHRYPIAGVQGQVDLAITGDLAL
jgi:hypothetical protein